MYMKQPVIKQQLIYLRWLTLVSFIILNKIQAKCLFQKIFKEKFYLFFWCSIVERCLFAFMTLRLKKLSLRSNKNSKMCTSSHFFTHKYAILRVNFFNFFLISIVPISIYNTPNTCIWGILVYFYILKWSPQYTRQ